MEGKERFYFEVAGRYGLKRNATISTTTAGSIIVNTPEGIAWRPMEVPVDWTDRNVMNIDKNYILNQLQIPDGVSWLETRNNRIRIGTGVAAYDVCPGVIFVRFGPAGGQKLNITCPSIAEKEFDIPVNKNIHCLYGGFCIKIDNFPQQKEENPVLNKIIAVFRAIKGR